MKVSYFQINKSDGINDGNEKLLFEMNSNYVPHQHDRVVFDGIYDVRQVDWSLDVSNDNDISVDVLITEIDYN